MPAPSGESYLVVGATGEYDDYYSWVVAVSLDRGAAEKFCRRLEKIAGAFPFMAMKTSGDARFDRWLAERDDYEAELRKAGDPQASVDYTGTHYRVKEAPLVG